MRHANSNDVHKGAYVSATDPSLDAENLVSPGKLWVDISSGPPYQLKVRNTDDDDWEDIGGVGGGGGGAGVFVGALLRSASDRTVPHDTVYAPSFGTVVYDTDNFNNSSPTRLTIPTGLGGYYRIWGQVAFETSALGTTRVAGLRKNGTTSVWDNRSAYNGTNELSIITLDVILPLAQADYIELTVYQNSGGNLLLKSYDGIVPYFGLHLLGT